MADKPSPQRVALDLPLAHHHFAADCFNRAWTLIEKHDRSSADDEQMVLLALASLWHWTQRADCTDQNLSIGHWQVSRTCALAGDAAGALRHGRRSLALAADSPPFFAAYAHEAIARAAAVAGDQALFQEHLAGAGRLLDRVTNQEERRILAQDLEDLRAKDPASR